MTNNNISSDEIFSSDVQDSFQKNINLLSVSDPILRREALSTLLQKSNLPFSIQQSDQTDTNSTDTKNYLISIGDQSNPHYLFCAHYDAFPGSCGANDNAAAVCILIELAKELAKSNNISAEFAFFDGEERNHTGSKLFVSNMNLDDHSILAVINLDICGYGDTIAVHSQGSVNKTPAYYFCNKSILSKHNGCNVKYLPESDHVSFKGTHLPILNIAIMPKYDIQFLKVLASYASNIIGKPPEYEVVLGQMEVMTTMHCNFRDKLETVQTSAMHQIYRYLLDALYNPVLKTSFFHRKI